MVVTHKEVEIFQILTRSEFHMSTEGTTLVPLGSKKDTSFKLRSQNILADLLRKNAVFNVTKICIDGSHTYLKGEFTFFDMVTFFSSPT